MWHTKLGSRLLEIYLSGCGPNMVCMYLQRYQCVVVSMLCVIKKWLVKFVCGLCHSRPENLKKSRPKKLVKSNKSISRKNFFDQIQFFAISKMAKNQFLNWENCQKCNFTEFFFNYLISRVFLAWTFLNLLASCVISRKKIFLIYQISRVFLPELF